MKFQSSVLWFSLKFTFILLQTQSEENEEHSLAMQRSTVIGKKLSSVWLPNQRTTNQKPQTHALIFML